MNPRSVAKVENQLALEEAALRERLLTELPTAAASGHDLFTNSRFNPHGLLATHLSRVSEQLLHSAEQCIAWREALGLQVQQSVGQLFIAACEERASGAAHRRGPKRLAEWLLGELPHAT
jgi:hypothetical protein